MLHVLLVKNSTRMTTSTSSKAQKNHRWEYWQRDLAFVKKNKFIRGEIMILFFYTISYLQKIAVYFK